MKKVMKYILVSIILLMIIAFGAFYIWSEQTNHQMNCMR